MTDPIYKLYNATTAFAFGTELYPKKKEIRKEPRPTTFKGKLKKN